MSERITKKSLTTEQRKERVKTMKNLFSGMSKDEAIKYLSNLYVNEMDKATMTAFMSVYTKQGDADRIWFNDVFLPSEATEEVKVREKKELDKVIEHKNRKGFTVSEQTYKFEEKEGNETKRVYKRIKASEAFAKHFDFKYKEAKEYDEFDELR